MQGGYVITPVLCLLCLQWNLPLCFWWKPCQEISDSPPRFLQMIPNQEKIMMADHWRVLAMRRALSQYKMWRAPHVLVQRQLNPNANLTPPSLNLLYLVNLNFCHKSCPSHPHPQPVHVSSTQFKHWTQKRVAEVSAQLHPAQYPRLRHWWPDQGFHTHFPVHWVQKRLAKPQIWSTWLCDPLADKH